MAETAVIDRRKKYYYAHREEMIMKVRNKRAMKSNIVTAADVEREIGSTIQEFNDKIALERQRCEEKIRSLDEKRDKRVATLRLLPVREPEAKAEPEAETST